MKSNKKTSADTFTSDLKYGENGENEIATFLQTLNLTFLGSSKCLHSDDKWKLYDLLFMNKDKKQIKVEVKTDNYISERYDSGNIIIEKSCGNKPSGISTTISDIWIYYFPILSRDNIWLIKTKELKQLIAENNFHICSGGYQNKCRLIQIPRKEFQDKFKVYSYSFKNKITTLTTETKSSAIVATYSTSKIPTFKLLENPLNDKDWLG